MWWWRVNKLKASISVEVWGVFVRGSTAHAKFPYILLAPLVITYDVFVF